MNYVLRIEDPLYEWNVILIYYGFFCMSLKLKYKMLIFSLKHQARDSHM